MDGTTQPSGPRRRLPKLLTLGVLLLTLFAGQLQAAPGVGAAYWWVDSALYCTSPSPVGTSPWGTATLGWSGYFLASSGRSNATMWQWNGSGWFIRSQSSEGASGRSGEATAFVQALAGAGSDLQVTGSHSSSFFDGWKYSESDIAYCP